VKALPVRNREAIHNHLAKQKSWSSWSRTSSPAGVTSSSSAG
jgi:hypothetical protein